MDSEKEGSFIDGFNHVAIGLLRVGPEIIQSIDARARAEGNPSAARRRRQIKITRGLSLLEEKVPKNPCFACSVVGQVRHLPCSVSLPLQTLRFRHTR